MTGEQTSGYDEPGEASGYDEHEYEDSLEPRHLIRRSDVVLKAGILMLGAGTSGLRVREIMRSVAHTVGIERLHAQITFTDIVLTVGRRGIFRTQIAEIPNPGVNAHRIGMLSELGHDLPERAGVSEVDARLQAIEDTLGSTTCGCWCLWWHWPARRSRCCPTAGRGRPPRCCRPQRWRSGCTAG